MAINRIEAALTRQRRRTLPAKALRPPRNEWSRHFSFELLKRLMELRVMAFDMRARCTSTPDCHVS
ncbi:hypothetical protein [Dyella sp. ASV21]|uniref:hypothetical protein n=1 Tax=Dyella sp. ASV21 TaxID=2795114 RepID=UPI0018ECED73|nr:hypothetical protein [Dyella sp. ASV21]